MLYVNGFVVGSWMSRSCTPTRPSPCTLKQHTDECLVIRSITLGIVYDPDVNEKKQSYY